MLTLSQSMEELKRLFENLTCLLSKIGYILCYREDLKICMPTAIHALRDLSN